MATKKTFQARALGALPVGLRGKFRGWGFIVKVQFEIDGTAAVEIWDQAGDVVARITGKNKNEIPAAVTRIKAGIMELEEDKTFFSIPSKMSKQLEKDIQAFVKNLYDEAAAENKAMKAKPTTAKKPSPAQKAARAKFAEMARAKAKKTGTRSKSNGRRSQAPAKKTRTRNAPGYQYGSSDRLSDERKKATPPGKRTSASGRVYYEYRKNRTDAPGSLTGLKSKNYVRVMFKNPAYNYTTQVAAHISAEDAKKYFVGKFFNVGIYPREKLAKCEKIRFYSVVEDNNKLNGGATVWEIEFQQYGETRRGVYYDLQNRTAESVKRAAFLTYGVPAAKIKVKKTSRKDFAATYNHFSIK